MAARTMEPGQVAAETATPDLTPGAKIWVHRRVAFNRKASFDARVLSLSDRQVVVEADEPLDLSEFVTLAGVSATPTRAQRDQVVRGRVRRVQHLESGAYHYVVERLASRLSEVRYWADAMVPWLAFTACLAAIVNVLFLKESNAYYFWYQPVANIYGIMVSVYIISRIVVSAFYKLPQVNNYEPTVSAIVACKNEEDSIRATIECLYRSDYPPDRLEVIVVNDGSTDNTLAEMERAREEHPELKIIDFGKNLGKRHGMAAGARIATGEILLYVDSDSFVYRDAIRRMVSSFADPDVGGVCGHARVHNASKNMLTKMQEVRYYTAFRIVKAAESLFSAVTCCSGCLAAYRRSYVMEFLDGWLNQTFLGAPATFGDDRAMTNSMLRRHKVVYNSEAMCATIVPETMRAFLRQQTRWKKSWIRESLRAGKFMWKKHPFAAISFYLGTIFPLVAPVVVCNALVLPFFGMGSFSYLYVYGAVLMTILYGLVYLGRHRNGMWIYGIFFSIFYMLVLVWLTYYALFTLRRNHWGTR